MIKSRSFARYIRELKDIQVLTPGQTLDLINQYRETKNERVISDIVKGNLRLVMLIAKDYVGHGIDYEELVEEGNLGLIKGSKQYDPKFGAKFSYYVSMWIRQGMLAAIARSGKIVSIPFDKFTRSNRMKKNERHGKDFEESHKIDCSSAEIDKVYSLSDINVDRQRASTEVEDLLRVLDHSEAFVIRNLYGIGEVGDPVSIKEIGILMNVSSRTVTSLRDSALQKMRKAMI